MNPVTSLEAYQVIKENGVLKKRTLQVYKYVHDNPQNTQLDAVKYFTDLRYSSVTARYSELRKTGFIRCTGTVMQENYNRGKFVITGAVRPHQLTPSEIRKQIEDYEMKVNGIMLKVASLKSQLNNQQSFI